MRNTTIRMRKGGAAWALVAAVLLTLFTNGPSQATTRRLPLPKPTWRNLATAAVLVVAATSLGCSQHAARLGLQQQHGLQLIEDGLRLTDTQLPLCIQKHPQVSEADHAMAMAALRLAAKIPLPKGSFFNLPPETLAEIERGSSACLATRPPIGSEAISHVLAFDNDGKRHVQLSLFPSAAGKEPGFAKASLAAAIVRHLNADAMPTLLGKPPLTRLDADIVGLDVATTFLRELAKLPKTEREGVSRGTFRGHRAQLLPNLRKAKREKRQLERQRKKAQRNTKKS